MSVHHTTTLPSGRTLEVSDEPESLRILGRSGELEIEIDLSGERPRLVLKGIDLDVRAVGTLSLEGEQVEVRSKTTMDLRAEGAVAVHSDADLRLTGALIHLN